ncbi:hypothetical protein OROHE_006943 [Orobanche hederae]
MDSFEQGIITFYLVHPGGRNGSGKVGIFSIYMYLRARNDKFWICVNGLENCCTKGIRANLIKALTVLLHQHLVRLL